MHWKRNQVAFLPFSVSLLSAFLRGALRVLYERSFRGFRVEARGQERPYGEPLRNVVGVPFSISSRGILFPPETGAAGKAISVSGFMARSLEPAEPRGQMSLLCWFLVQRTFASYFHPCPSHLLPERPKISQLGEHHIP